MDIRAFFDPATFTLTYVVFDPKTRDAVIIDPVLDFDPVAAQTSISSVESVVTFVRAEGLRTHYVLETHAHADHLSSSQLLKRRLDARIAIGERITEVQEAFKGIFDLGPDFRCDGSQFDRLLRDGETLEAGSLRIEVLATPGHTPACVSFRIEDAVFVGDALFIEDSGTGRCDFPRGSASELYHSVHERLYALPDTTRVLVGHDYQPGGRELRYETTIAASKRSNIQLRVGTTLEEYVAFRQARDATLTPPRLLFQSVQVNVQAGRLPAVHADGRRYLTIPLNLFGPADDVGAPLAAERRETS
jgi:glyoxylase-like metal-dependent hydrolase (beta-lactamase superfamily II)